MCVIADTGVNIKPQINRLDNYYMLLVPIHLIAVSLPPFTRQGNAVHSFLWRVLRGAFVLQSPPTDCPDTCNPLEFCPGMMSGGALQAGLLKSALNMLLVVRFMLAYARITMMPWYLFENERIIWSL